MWNLTKVFGSWWWCHQNQLCWSSLKQIGNRLISKHIFFASFGPLKHKKHEIALATEMCWRDVRRHAEVHVQTVQMIMSQNTMETTQVGHLILTTMGETGNYCINDNKDPKTSSNWRLEKYTDGEIYLKSRLRGQLWSVLYLCKYNSMRLLKYR